MAEQQGEESKALATRAPAEIAIQNGGLLINNVEQVRRLAAWALEANMIPKGLNNVQGVTLALLYGLEVGLSGMQALQNVMVVNNRPSLFGDAALALVRQSGQLQTFSETITGEGDSRIATCKTRRKGDTEDHVSSFSVADAKRAKLWGKDGPWTFYPDRMLQMRARAFCLRDVYPDVLKGMAVYEEVRDTIDVTPETARTVRASDPAPESHYVDAQVSETTTTETQKPERATERPKAGAAKVAEKKKELLAILREQNLDPATWVAEACGKLGIRAKDLTVAQINNLITLAVPIGQAPDTTRDDAIAAIETCIELAGTTREIIETGCGKKIDDMTIDELRALYDSFQEAQPADGEDDPR